MEIRGAFYGDKPETQTARDAARLAMFDELVRALEHALCVAPKLQETRESTAAWHAIRNANQVLAKAREIGRE